MGFLGFGSSNSEASSSTVASRTPSPDTLAANPPHKEGEAVNPLNPKGLKPCCACPETKSARDDCFLRSSPDEADIKCKDLLEAHKACMRGYGFKV